MANSVPLDSFCSVLSMMGDEPLAGTAMSAPQYVFISWPKKFWARKQFESRHFPAGLSAYLQDLQRERRVFTRLIHRRSRVLEAHSRIFIMPDGVTYSGVPADEIESVLRSYFDGELDGKHRRGNTHGSYIFCCTHGRRDRCCAKFGQSVLYELERAALEMAFDLEVWECTHLGADRLAAIAVAFPHGYMYGRMRVDNVSEIIEFLIKGYPYPPCYRGQLGLGSVEQTAQAFGLFYWFVNGIEGAAVEVDSITQGSQDDYEASVTIKDKSSGRAYAKFALSLRKKDFPTYMDCDGVRANEVRRVSRWVISESRLIG